MESTHCDIPVTYIHALYLTSKFGFFVLQTNPNPLVNTSTKSKLKTCIQNFETTSTQDVKTFLQLNEWNQFWRNMVVRPQYYLEHITSLLKIHLGKFTFSEDSLCTSSVNGKNSYGIINTINSILSESKSNLLGSSPLEKAEIQQWIEYAIVYVVNIDSNAHSMNSILKELNDILSTKTYLVSHRLTVADILLYYILLNVMVSLSSLKKEKYMNISRWFDNLQQDTLLRQSNTLVNFNTNYLTSIVPAKH